MLPEKDRLSAGEEHWRWRMEIVQRMARQLEPHRFGVKALYLLGSVKTAKAGPASDIDLLVHDDGDERQRRELTLWLEGWSLCLDEFNIERTGHRTGGLFDVHFATDEDVARKDSFTVKIGSPHDPALRLRLKGEG